jgi:hypothetical protein
MDDTDSIQESCLWQLAQLKDENARLRLALADAWPYCLPVTDKDGSEWVEGDSSSGQSIEPFGDRDNKWLNGHKLQIQENVGEDSRPVRSWWFEFNDPNVSNPCLAKRPYEQSGTRCSGTPTAPKPRHERTPPKGIGIGSSGIPTATKSRRVMPPSRNETGVRGGTRRDGSPRDGTPRDGTPRSKGSTPRRPHSQHLPGYSFGFAPRVMEFPK